MYDDYTKVQFEISKETDADYLLICNSDGQHSSQNIIPLEDYWENIEEAIIWHFEHNWNEIEIYDLYAPFETSMIRRVSKVANNIDNLG